MGWKRRRRVTMAELAYLFYSGVPWEKLTKAEQAAFHRYVKERARG